MEENLDIFQNYEDFQMRYLQFNIVETQRRLKEKICMLCIPEIRQKDGKDYPLASSCGQHHSKRPFTIPRQILFLVMKSYYPESDSRY